jgi:hypothetical protein
LRAKSNYIGMKRGETDCQIEKRFKGYKLISLLLLAFIRHPLSGGAFVNTTTASSDDETRKLFQYVDPAAGFGLRIMFSRKTLSNLCIDFGFGADGTKGIFFNLNETF